MSQQARPRRHDLLGLRRSPRAPARRRGRPCAAHHRLPLLARGDGAARVRGPVTRSRTRGSTSRTRTTSTCCSPAWASGRADTPVVITHHRRAAPSDARRVRRAPRAHVPPAAGLPVRPRRRRAAGRPAWPPRCTARRKGSTPSRSTRVATGGQAGASSRIENYVGFPNGISGEELASRAAIQAQRLGARLERAVRGRGPARRARLPRGRARRRQRDPVPQRSIVASGRALPAARRRRPRAVRRRRRVLRGDRPRGAHLQRPARDRRRRRELRRPGRDLPRAAGQPGVDRDPRRRPHRTACRTTSSSGSRPTRASSCSPRTEVRALDGDEPPRAASRSSTRRPASGGRSLLRAVLLHRRRPRDRLARTARSRSTTKGFVLTDRVASRRDHAAARCSRRAIRCRSRRRCPACSRSATCATAR